jgi:hypothetical protein
MVRGAWIVPNPKPKRRKPRSILKKVVLEPRKPDLSKYFPLLAKS